MFLDYKTTIVIWFLPKIPLNNRKAGRSKVPYVAVFAHFTLTGRKVVLY